MKFKILIILIVCSSVILQSSCSNGSAEANVLFGDVNKDIAKYVKIESSEIIPLREEINKTDGSIVGTKKSLQNVEKILTKVDSQIKAINEAKNKLKKVLNLSVNNNVSTYAILTDKALMADLDILKTSRKLYSNLKKMYLLASQNNLSQKEYEIINKEVQSLTKTIASLEEIKNKRYQKRDLYYNNKLKIQ